MNILRRVLLGLAALAGVIVGATLLQKAIRLDAPPPPLGATASTRPGEPGPSAFEIVAAQHGLEEKLKAAPEYATFFDRLKTVFPLEYESFLAAFAKRLATKRDVGNTDFLMAEALRSLRVSRGVLAAKAGNEALEHIFELQSSMLGTLAAKDPHLCVDFLNGTESA
ncbi:MAG TPA: hypothetical protein VMU78_02185, partial [Methylocella sp.]|nr:hypothetical protein [Methylocella sp.]